MLSSFCGHIASFGRARKSLQPMAAWTKQSCHTVVRRTGSTLRLGPNSLSPCPVFGLALEGGLGAAGANVFPKLGGRPAPNVLGRLVRVPRAKRDSETPFRRQEVVALEADRRRT